MLEHHWKAHAKPIPQETKPATQPEPEPPRKKMPRIRFINNETGESMDAQGNEYPPPPNYKPEPIIPGVYKPDDLRYDGPTQPKGGRHRR
jgi:hypothetical protein